MRVVDCDIEGTAVVYRDARRGVRTKEYVVDYVVARRVMAKYPGCPATMQFAHPLANDTNQHLCNGWRLPGAVDADLEAVTRVCRGLKPFAALSGLTEQTVAECLSRIQASGAPVQVNGPLPYRRRLWNGINTSFMLDVALHGSLADVYGLDALRTLAEDWERLGIRRLDLSNRCAVFMPLSSFFGSVVAGPDEDSFINAWERVPPQVVGLLLGYPADVTASFG